MSFSIESTLLVERTLKEFWKQFLALLETADAECDEDFCAAVRYSIDFCGVTTEQFIEEFGISSGTVSRWARGKSLPHVMARPRILDWVKVKVNQRRKELE